MQAISIPITPLRQLPDSQEVKKVPVPDRYRLPSKLAPSTGRVAEREPLARTIYFPGFLLFLPLLFLPL